MKLNEEKVVGVYAHILRFLNKCTRDNVPALAGQSTFFLLLSAVPFMMFGFSVLSMFFGIEQLQIKVPELGGEVSPYVQYLIRFIDNSIRRSGSGTTIVTAVAALWSAGKGIYCITEGISRIYRLPKKRIWLTKRIFAMGYTLIMMLIYLLGIAVMAVVSYFGGAITRWADGSTFVSVLLAIGFFIVFGVVIALMMALALKLFLGKKVKDKRRRSMRALLPGTLLTAAAWHLLTIGVIIYVNYFATSSIYGSLGTVIVFMMWIYFMMYLLLFGIQLNCIYYEQFYDLKLWKLLPGRRAAEKKET